MKMTAARNRAMEVHADLHAPWRCVACGVPVRLGFGDPCRCPGMDRAAILKGGTEDTEKVVVPDS